VHEHDQHLCGAPNGETHTYIYIYIYMYGRAGVSPPIGCGVYSLGAVVTLIGFRINHDPGARPQTDVINQESEKGI
jgi:hypothetical protein